LRGVWKGVSSLLAWYSIFDRIDAGGLGCPCLQAGMDKRTGVELGLIASGSADADIR
jgi:hypothetical protein